MKQLDQDVEKRLKSLNVAELAALLDFVIPNRPDAPMSDAPGNESKLPDPPTRH